MTLGLAALAEALGAAQVGHADDERVLVTSVSHDSRKVTPGALLLLCRRPTVRRT